jgi:anti-sigma B factor antagonist
MTELKLSKNLNVKEARNFASKLKPELQAEQPCVVVDMSEVQQVEAAGLELLLRSILRVAKRDGSVRLAGISPQAATMLEITRMDRIFAMFPEAADVQPYFEVPVAQTVDENSRQPSAA